MLQYRTVPYLRICISGTLTRMDRKVSYEYVQYIVQVRCEYCSSSAAGVQQATTVNNSGRLVSVYGT